MKNVSKKMSLDALKEKAKQVATKELMNEISGGVQASCHTKTDYERLRDFFYGL